MTSQCEEETENAEQWKNLAQFIGVYRRGGAKIDGWWRKLPPNIICLHLSQSENLLAIAGFLTNRGQPFMHFLQQNTLCERLRQIGSWYCFYCAIRSRGVTRISNRFEFLATTWFVIGSSSRGVNLWAEWAEIQPDSQTSHTSGKVSQPSVNAWLKDA